MADLVVDILNEKSATRLKAEMTLPSKRLSVLYGKQGAGRSRLLRTLAGLESADGKIQIGDTVWQDGNKVLTKLPKRPVALTFSEPRLFPHKTLKENLNFGVRLRSKGNGIIGTDILTEVLGLGELAGKAIAELNPFQSHMVSLARAIQSKPELLLIDEPNLPLEQREIFASKVVRLAMNLPIPVLMATSSVETATRVASHIVYLEDGITLASGSVNELMSRLDLPLCRDPGASTRLRGIIASHDKEQLISHVDFRGGRLHAPLLHRPQGKRAEVRLHVEGATLSANAPTGASSSLNNFPVIVKGMSKMEGNRAVVLTVAGDAPVLVHIPRQSANALKIGKDKRLFVSVPRITLPR